MKLNHQQKYFINGIILLVLAMLTVTVLPPVVKAKTAFNLQNYFYYEAEFFLLCASAIFFLFSPKYYKHQVFAIFLCVLYYVLFIKLY